MTRTQPNPDWPTQPPFPTGPGPQLARPGDDDMPLPTPVPQPWPQPGRMSLRIARVLFQAARYLVGLGVVVGAASWLTTYASGVFWLGLLIAAMVANPWRPKRPSRPWSTATRAAVHSLLLRAGGRARRGGLSPLPLG